MKTDPVPKIPTSTDVLPISLAGARRPVKPRIAGMADAGRVVCESAVSGGYIELSFAAWNLDSLQPGLWVSQEYDDVFEQNSKKVHSYAIDKREQEGISLACLKPCSQHLTGCTGNLAHRNWARTGKITG